MVPLGRSERGGDPGGALPPRRTLALPGRGRLVVRAAEPDHAGRPTVLLLHGLAGTADLAWHGAYRPLLAAGYGVVALDHRGHGGGLATDGRFRLEDCADDAAAVLDALGLGPVVVAGYSMGGPIAQLLWERHRDHVAGLVLVATARNFRGRPTERLGHLVLPAVAASSRLVPVSVARHGADVWLASRLVRPELRRWAVGELRKASPRAVLEAACALGAFSSRDWVGEIDVPTAVVVTEADTVVPPSRQLRLAAAIPGAEVVEVAGDHHVLSREPETGVPALLEALAVASSGRVRPADGRDVGENVHGGWPDLVRQLLPLAGDVDAEAYLPVSATALLRADEWTEVLSAAQRSGQRPPEWVREVLLEAARASRRFPAAS